MSPAAINKSDSAPSLRDYEASSLRRDRAGSGGDAAADERGPLVSVVTIVFNAEKTLDHAIQSVLEQTYGHIEYIIIDGSSTDGSPGIIKKYESRIAYWVSEPDRGISDAFNKGIAAAQGDIIGILNADDWYEKDAVAQAVEKIKSSGADIVYGMIQWWDHDSAAEKVSANHELLDREMSLNHPSVFATRAAYERIGLYRTDFLYAMDYEWLLRAKKAGLTFAAIPHCIANMRLEGVSNNHWQRALKEEMLAKNLSCPGSGPIIFYYYKTAKSFTRRLLERMGMTVLVRLFHSYISSVKKTGTGR
ncbi:MAG: glycosyltransferase [Nitrospirae bacterium]|nr:glycosyltransferase [Nitrospirota bacterium]